MTQRNCYQKLRGREKKNLRKTRENTGQEGKRTEEKKERSSKQEKNNKKTARTKK